MDNASQPNANIHIHIHINLNEFNVRYRKIERGQTCESIEIWDLRGVLGKCEMAWGFVFRRELPIILFSEWKPLKANIITLN